MGKPQVTINNYQAVYDYYRHNQTDPDKLNNEFAAQHERYKDCSVTWDDGAMDRTQQLIDEEHTFIICPNHILYEDQFLIASAMSRTALQALIPSMRILAKDEYFRTENRDYLDERGGIPVFRPKDHGLKAIVNPTHALIDTVAHRLTQGDSIEIFGEGTRNVVDHQVVQPMGNAIGRIACQAIQREQKVAIVTIALNYNDTNDSMNGRAHINAPLTALPETDIKITRAVRDDLQRGVTGLIHKNK